jgi:hypothetical protein
MRKGRLALLLGSAATVAVLALFGWTVRDWLYESWGLIGLGRARGAEKIAWIERLAGAGAERSAAALLGLLEETGPREAQLDYAASKALQPLARRLVLKGKRREAARRLLALAGDPESDSVLEHLAAALLGLTRGDPAVLSDLLAALPGASLEVQKLISRTVLECWREDRMPIERFLEKAAPEDVAALLVPAVLALKERRWAPRRATPAPILERAREVAAHLAAAHADPRVRAVALSCRVPLGSTDNSFPADGKPLLEAWASDPSPLVRIAALRIAGFVGSAESDFYLPRLLHEEQDAVLLTEVVHALTVWSSALRHSADGIELWEGFACGWLPRSPGFERRWADEDLERLRALLATRPEPDLRDACSLALARRHRGTRPRTRPRRRPQSSPLPGFRVHEWGVWRDTGGALLPAALAPDDLPAFVHRLEVDPGRIAAQRFFTPAVVFKPVVRFHAPEPLVVYFRVDFHEGMPWTWYPAATDFVETLTEVSFSPAATRRGAARNGAPEGSSQEEAAGAQGEEPNVTALTERSHLAPPWLSGRGAVGARRAAGLDEFPFHLDPSRGNPEELRRFYELVPWLIPGQVRHALVSRTGIKVLSGLGLEWCGLRVGFPPELEGPEPEAPEGSWWEALRRVPGSRVAVRGASERFLFYDGAVNLPSPVAVAWADASRRGLLLSVRPFGQYPTTPRSFSDHWARSPLPAVFVIRREGGGKLRGALLEGLMPSAEPIHLPLARLGELAGDVVGRRLEEMLVREGLCREEAAALLACWRLEFLETPGLRVLTVLPRSAYDTLLPCELYPSPQDHARVGLV